MSDLSGLYHQRRVQMAVCLSDDVGGDSPEENAARVTAGRAPWPGINGNPPIDRDRPFLDLRRLAEAENVQPE